MVYKNLNPEKALIWRIIHIDNLAWVLQHGLHCANSANLSDNYVNIGNTELISKRQTRQVPVAPGGVLADYVPFYFTPFSVMMMNIHSGRGVKKRDNDDIIILVSSLYQVKELGLPFVFTNAHAYPGWTHYYNDLNDLSEIDWALLQKRDFKRDDEDPQKIERYQAEALIHQHLPVFGLIGIICHSTPVLNRINQQLQQSNQPNIPVHVRKEWYFQ